MRRILPGLPDGYWHGGQSTAGLAVDWVVRLLGRSPDDLERAAAGIPVGSDGLSFRETLLDRRTPDPEPGLRGVWTGLTLFHGSAHMYRSVVEGVAWGARHAAGSLRPTEIVATGGLVQRALFMESLATAFRQPIGLLRHERSAAFGAAFAHNAQGSVELNPVVRWIEPNSLAKASVFRRYAALHRLPRAITSQTASEVA
jgi:sugar (pentulose or hexulose) kinase